MKLKHLFFTLLSLLTLTGCKSDSPDEAIADKYCLMFYIIEGDKEHADMDRHTIESFIAATETTNVVGTYFLQPCKDSEKTSTERYTIANGKATLDETWSMPKKDFDITNERILAEFISWSAAQFPGYKYIIVPIGHGEVWTDIHDEPEASTESRSLLRDDNTGLIMASSDFADAINISTVKFAAVIANVCLQANIENLAEWRDAATYIVASESYMPDLGGPYAWLARKLDSKGGDSADLKQVLTDFVNVIGEYFDAYEREDLKIRTMTGLYDTQYLPTIEADLTGIFSHMKASVNNLVPITDLPAVYGQTYAEAYRRAINAAPVVNSMDPEYRCVDLLQMLYNCCVYTADHSMINAIESLRAHMKKFVIVSHASSGFDNSYHTVAISADLEKFANRKYVDAYRHCNFDLNTNYSAMMNAIAVK